MKERGIEKDDFNIEAQARITVGHEIGHGITDYFCDIISTEDEEQVVEEFGEYMFPEATGVYNSELVNILEEYLSINRQENR